MKKLIAIASLIFSVGIFSGCDKTTNEIMSAKNVIPEHTFLKINYVSAYASNPGVQLAVNGIRVSNLITARTPFPGGGYNTGGGSNNDYLAFVGGNTTVKVVIPVKTTATDSVTLFEKALNLEAGKHYSLHITDTASKTKYLLLEDILIRPDTGRSKFRFVNLMPNVPAIDLYYGTTKVADNIAYLTSSPYFEVLRPATALAWTIREAGTSPTSTALATYTSANTTLDQRVYTAFAVGYKGAPDAARKPYISFYLNY